MQLDLLDKPKVGHSNGVFLGDLANGASAATLRANWQAGKYPGLNPEIAKANLAFHGQSHPQRAKRD